MSRLMHVELVVDFGGEKVSRTKATHELQKLLCTDHALDMGVGPLLIRNVQPASVDEQAFWRGAFGEEGKL